MSWFSDPSSIGSPNFPNIFDQWRKSDFATQWGGGKWRDRTKTTLPTTDQLPPGFQKPGEKHALSVTLDKTTEALGWLSDKTTEGLTALSSPGSGIHRLGTNLEASWKGLYEGLEYPERTWKQWQKLDLGNTGSPGGSSGSSSSSGDNGGVDPTKPNEYTYNINVGGLDLTEMESERERADRMRRMLAGRYGRGETNLTGGTGFGTGSQRTLGGYA